MQHVDTTIKSPAILSFCPGILGLERGLERAIGSIRTVAYVEIEAFIIENLVQAMEQGKLAAAPIFSNLKTFNARPFRGKIHGIIGGYPCQPFSNAGSRKGEEDPRHLWPYICEHIRGSEPLWCFFENVAGHLTLGYDEVYKSLRDMGYHVEAGIFTAEEAGAPHKRERLFILAVKLGYAEMLHVQGCAGRQRQRESGGAGDEQENELADSRLFGQKIRQKRTTGIKQCCKESMDDSKGINRRIQLQSKESRQDSIESVRSNETNMADTDSSRSGEDTESGKLRTDSIKQPSCDNGSAKSEEDNEGRFDRWPAGPGEQQYDWEEPRTATDSEQAKRGMGGSTDGHNFREDLLRAYGNSVVEQTAEIAFLNLLEKHLCQKNHPYSQ